MAICVFFGVPSQACSQKAHPRRMDFSPGALGFKLANSQQKEEIQRHQAELLLVIELIEMHKNLRKNVGGGQKTTSR